MGQSNCQEDLNYNAHGLVDQLLRKFTMGFLDHFL